MKETITIGDTQTEVSGEIDKINVTLHKTVEDPPDVRIKLMKMSKGYQWEISAEGPDTMGVLDLIDEADERLRQRFAAEAE